MKLPLSVLAGLGATILSLAVTYPAPAVPISFTDLAAYTAAAGSQRIIYFTELDEGTVVGTQYSGLGVRFTDGDDTILADNAFATDGMGLHGNGAITLQFDSAITSLGVEFPGALRIQLFSGTTLVGVSQDFGGSGTGYFGGVVSDVAFDRAVLSDWMDDRAFIDNLEFGQPWTPPPTPVPDVASSFSLLLIGLGALSFVVRKPERAARRSARSRL